MDDLEMETATGGYAEGITRSARKAQLRGARQVLAVKQGSHVTVPTTVFNGHEGSHFTSPYNDPLVIELKVASTVVRRIFIDTRSSVDIIIWDCSKKVKYPGREIFPLVHPILGFGGKKLNSAGIIPLPLRFGDKAKARNLEVDFLVVDVPAADNVILGRPILHKGKAVIASYLLQLQFDMDDKSVCKLQVDQRIAWECYLISIRPLVDRSVESRPIGPPPSDKKQRTVVPPLAEPLVIHTLPLPDPERPCPKVVNGIEEISLDKGRPD
ncbi:hypothetical protein Cgig2_024385 [Carnegiea gigantea]|uniref:Uncharacterized protein n=1 Tax=Carnegiea gigantea TaxID=171969 RepID=A0A9Q1JW84_9CARY|nr:hypothetical protein Cgig2_024385 [Carnegiea gigantea]